MSTTRKLATGIATTLAAVAVVGLPLNYGAGAGDKPVGGHIELIVQRHQAFANLSPTQRVTVNDIYDRVPASRDLTPTSVSDLAMISVAAQQALGTSDGRKAFRDQGAVAIYNVAIRHADQLQHDPHAKYSKGFERRVNGGGGN